MGSLFYIKVEYLFWSGGQVTRSNPKYRRHLTEHIGGQYRNSGSPDRRNLWGDGGFAVVKENKTSLAKGAREFSTKTSIPTGLEKLGNLIKDNMDNTALVNKKMLNLISDKEILMAAYTKLKSAPGNMTPGVDKETLDGLDSS